MDFDERILEAARQFHQAAQFCGGHSDESGEPEDWLVFPEIVNYAFASELALKGLHWVHLSKPPHGHDLEKLCMSLPPMLVAEMAEQTLTPSALFRGRLHEVRSAFQDWRYAFEKDEFGMTIAFLANLAGAAIEALRRDAALAAGSQIQAKLEEDRIKSASTHPPPSKSDTKRLVEIRLGWSAEVRAITDGGWPEGELWAPDNPELRRELESMVEVGNKLFGSDSHSIEEREGAGVTSTAPLRRCSARYFGHPHIAELPFASLLIAEA